MIQVNLLPDVKREYLRAQQMKHIFMVVSILSTITALGLLALLFAYVQIVQPRHRANLQEDIDAGISELKNNKDAVKIVTTQGVLEQIPGLQDKKFVTSSLFNYLIEFTPRDVAYNKVRLDLATNTLTLSGQTTTLERANVLANNLKSANFTYTEDDANSSKKPFSNIVFNTLGKSNEALDGKNVGFEITLQIDPIMFSQKISNTKITVNASSEELLLPTAEPFSETTSTGVTQ